jgi:hypothetical protein
LGVGCGAQYSSNAGAACTTASYNLRPRDFIPRALLQQRKRPSGGPYRGGAALR